MSRIDEHGLVSFADRELYPLLLQFAGAAKVQDLRSYFVSLQCALAVNAAHVTAEAADRILGRLRADLDAATTTTPLDDLIGALAHLVRAEIAAHPDRALGLLMAWPVPCVVNGKASIGWPRAHGAELTLTVQAFFAEIDSALASK